MNTTEKLFERLQRICNADSQSLETYQFSLLRSVELPHSSMFVIECKDADGDSCITSVILDNTDVLFYLSDWQGTYPTTEQEITEYDWREEFNHPVIMMNGMPRILI